MLTATLFDVASITGLNPLGATFASTLETSHHCRWHSIRLFTTWHGHCEICGKRSEIRATDSLGFTGWLWGIGYKTIPSGKVISATVVYGIFVVLTIEGMGSVIGAKIVPILTLLVDCSPLLFLGVVILPTYLLTCPLTSLFVILPHLNLMYTQTQRMRS